MGQHKKPCSECPFNRNTVPGALGGSSPEVYIGQAYAPFWIPCHMQIDYSDPNWKSNLETPQCAGTAIFRSNVGKERKGFLLSLPVDTELVFKDAVEFMMHHAQITREEAEKVLAVLSPEDLAEIQLARVSNKVYVKLRNG